MHSLVPVAGLSSASSFGKASKKCMRGGDIAERIQKRAIASKASAAGASAAATTAATVVTLPPPVGPIGAAVLAAVAVSLVVGNGLRDHDTLALTGDKRAIAAFMRRSARWSSARRKRVMVRLHKILQRVIATKRRQCEGPRGRSGKGPTDEVLVREGKLKLKIGALVAQEMQAGKSPHRRLVKGDPKSTPAVADQDPKADQDSPTDLHDPPEFSIFDMQQKVAGVPVPYLVGGGLFFLGLIGVFALRRPPQQPQFITPVSRRAA